MRPPRHKDQYSSDSEVVLLSRFYFIRWTKLNYNLSNNKFCWCLFLPCIQGAMVLAGVRHTSLQKSVEQHWWHSPLLVWAAARAVHTWKQIVYLTKMRWWTFKTVKYKTKLFCVKQKLKTLVLAIVNVIRWHNLFHVHIVFIYPQDRQNSRWINLTADSVLANQITPYKFCAISDK